MINSAVWMLELSEVKENICQIFGEDFGDNSGIMHNCSISFKYGKHLKPKKHTNIDVCNLCLLSVCLFQTAVVAAASHYTLGPLVNHKPPFFKMEENIYTH